MKIFEHMRFSALGFSVKRMAYLLVVIDALLLPLHAAHSWAGWRVDELLLVVAVAFILVTLTLAFFIPRTDKHRFLPFGIAVVLYGIHAYFSPA